MSQRREITHLNPIEMENPQCGLGLRKGKQGFGMNSGAAITYGNENFLFKKLHQWNAVWYNTNPSHSAIYDDFVSLKATHILLRISKFAKHYGN